MVLNSDEIFDFVCGLMLPISFLINKTLYTKVKNEEHREKGKVIQEIIKTYSLVQCILLPCIAIFQTLLHISIVTLEFIEITTARYLIAALKCVGSYYVEFVSLHSLIIAISRYAFLVFDSKAERFGVKNLRKVLLLSSICVPVLTTILYDATFSINTLSYFCRYLNGCRSSQIPNVNGSVNVNDDHDSSEYDSPLYLIVKENFPKQFIYGIKLFLWVLWFLFYSNIMEGFIYLHTFIAMKRYYNKG